MLETKVIAHHLSDWRNLPLGEVAVITWFTISVTSGRGLWVIKVNLINPSPVLIKNSLKLC